MSDWTEGYVADIGYTFGYYQELNPLRSNLALLSNGFAPPRIENACELGFGQGVSIALHAAASQVQWSGTDFNPSQAAHARSLGNAGGLTLPHLAESGFEEFCQDPDLPEFDFIALHGIWSWISDHNRSVIADFARRKLRAGGVLYLSYNTLPGWSAFAPLRHLMTRHAEVMGSQGGGTKARIEGALEFARSVLAANPVYAQAHPVVGTRFEAVQKQDRHYLAHEYFNRDWHPMYFDEASRMLGSAKLDFGCSAHYLDHVDPINLSADQRALLQGIPDRILKETVRDFMVNQQFRRDYWIKGARRLTAPEQQGLLRKVRLILQRNPTEVALTLNGPLGTVTLNENIYKPLLDVLSDFKIHTLGHLEGRLQDKGISFNQLLQAVVVLVGCGHLAPAQDESQIQRARKQTDKLNTHICHRALVSSDLAYLASPVTGGGIPAGRIQLLFAAGHGHGHKGATELARYVWGILAAQGEKITKDGRRLEAAEENIAELVQQAQIWSDVQSPILKALQVL